MTNNTDFLLHPYTLNSTLTLKNRIIMAPMTRNMADDDLNATDAMSAYYTKRADAGLIITEGTIIRADAKGYSNVPGIFTDAQIQSWQKVTEQVHAKNGLIFMQIWHLGRVSHPHFLAGDLPLAPSETIMTERVNRSPGLFYGKSRAVSLDEIEGLVESYATAAKNARLAGFDGIEIHGANGYLIDQFLHHHTNLREDNYGKTPENMARFALEVVKACGGAIGYDRVGLRLSPGAYLNEIKMDTRDNAVFRYLLSQLNNLAIAYVHTGNFDDSVVFPELDMLGMTDFMRQYYHGTLIGCGSYTLDTALDHILTKRFDLIAIGRAFLANPDLIQKYKHQTNLAIYDNSMLATLD
ncbi:MAG: alkene reductase [Gammaproteobacteria bacterium]|nr:alkene reductase [Gammaproteobacteria bacterium]